MLKIGLTGGIGSGKSTAAALIREAGYPVIDSDQIARAVLDIYPEIKEYIRREYGEDFVKDGQLDRRKLAGVVFKDPAKLKAYQCVIMPYIILEIRSRLDTLERAGAEMAFIDAPLLFEEAGRLPVDCAVLVDVPEAVQIQRVKGRDNLTEAEIRQRMDRQMSRAEKLKLADYVLSNDGTLDDLKGETKKLLRELLRRMNEEKKQQIK